VWTLFVPRALGPAGIGQLAAALAVTNLALALAGMGSRSLLVREIAIDHSRGSGLLGTALTVRLAVILPCIAAIVGYGWLMGFHDQQLLLLYLATVLIMASLCTDIFQAGLQAVEKMRYLAYGEVLNKTVGGLIGVGLALVGFRVVAQMVNMVALGLIVLALTTIWTLKNFSIDWQVDLARIRSFLGASLAYWPCAIFATIYLWIDMAMLSVLAPATVVGWYAVSTRLFTTLMFVPTIFSTVWLPRLSRIYEQDRAGFEAASRVPLEIILVIGLPVATGVALISEPLTRTIYGPAFLPSVPSLALLAFTTIPMYTNMILAQILVASNRLAVWTWAMAGASIINPVLNYLLISHFQRTAGNGAIGAALSLLLTEIVMVGFGLVVVPHVFDSRVLARLGRAAVATAGMAVLVLLVARFGLLAEVVTGIVAFTGLALLLRVASREEIDQIASLWPALGRLLPKKRKGIA
jgi:O-antigen/teichoic acid export membrane protein